MNTFNFNDRDTYIAFRKEWKEKYKILSLEIRGLKITRKEQARKGEGSYAIYSLMQKSQQATAMMLLLAAAKEEANRQWLANREGVAA